MKAIVIPIVVWGISFLFLWANQARAQPPVAPDRRPKEIALDELDRVIGGPTLVTLKFADAPPGQVFASWAKQAGAHFDPILYDHQSLKKKPAITVAMEGVPCLAALRALAAKTDQHFALVPNYSPVEKTATGLALRLQPADDPQLRMQGPMLARGPFVVIATSVQRIATFGLDDDKDRSPSANNRYRIDFVIMADPKLLGHGMVGAPRIFEPKDWTVRATEREEMWSRREYGTPPLEWRFSAQRQFKASDAKDALAFKAVADYVHITTKTEAWDVPNILQIKDMSKEVTLAEGKRLYTIHEIVPANVKGPRGQIYSVRLSISGVGITKKNWSGWPELQPNNVVDSLRIVDAQGRDFALYRSFKQKDLEFSGQFWNGDGRGLGETPEGPPVRLIWTLPAEIRAVTIPIDFPFQEATNPKAGP